MYLKEDAVPTKDSCPCHGFDIFNDSCFSGVIMAIWYSPEAHFSASIKKLLTPLNDYFFLKNCPAINANYPKYRIVVFLRRLYG